MMCLRIWLKQPTLLSLIVILLSLLLVHPVCADVTDLQVAANYIYVTVENPAPDDKSNRVIVDVRDNLGVLERFSTEVSVDAYGTSGATFYYDFKRDHTYTITAMDDAEIRAGGVEFGTSKTLAYPTPKPTRTPTAAPTATMTSTPPPIPTATVTSTAPPIPISTVTANIIPTIIPTSAGMTGEEIYGHIYIISNPSGASIYIDGQYIGTTPNYTSMEGGKYLVELRMDGYDGCIGDVEITANSSTSAGCNLTYMAPSGPPWYATKPYINIIRDVIGCVILVPVSTVALPFGPVGGIMLIYLLATQPIFKTAGIITMLLTLLISIDLIPEYYRPEMLGKMLGNGRFPISRRIYYVINNTVGQAGQRVGIPAAYTDAMSEKDSYMMGGVVETETPKTTDRLEEIEYALGIKPGEMHESEPEPDHEFGGGMVDPEKRKSQLLHAKKRILSSMKELNEKKVELISKLVRHDISTEAFKEFRDMLETSESKLKDELKDIDYRLRNIPGLT